MKHTNTPNAGELLAGFLTEAIQDQAAALTPEQERAGIDNARRCGLEIVEAGPGLFQVIGYGRTFHTSGTRAACIAFCNLSGPAIHAAADAGILKRTVAQ